MKTINLFLLVFAALQMSAQKDTGKIKHKNYLSIEIDPAPCILKGYSISLKYSPRAASHLTFMGSVYGSRFPDKMMSKGNYDKGMRNLKIETSYALFADYFLNSKRTGLHFGPSVFLYNKSVGLDNYQERCDFTSVYPNLRIGYVYKPFESLGFYINPWFNMGKEVMLGNGNSIRGIEYSMSNLSYVLAIHIGYQVTF
jgi:hypothetical protein